MTAYGWPADLAGAEILSRFLELNEFLLRMAAERAGAEYHAEWEGTFGGGHGM